MSYQIDIFRQRTTQTPPRMEVDIIVANKYPEHFNVLMDHLLGLDSGCDFTVYRIEGDRPDFSFSKAMNAGLYAGSSPYVLFLNDDVLIVQPNWLKTLVESLEAFDLPLINPIQIDLTVPNDRVYQNRLMTDLERDPIRYVSSANKYGPKFLLGFCLLGRREDFLKVGGWDEDYSYHFEDIDISLRMEHLRGGKNGVSLSTWVRHGGGVSTNRTKEDPQAWAILKQKIDDSKACFVRKWGQDIGERLGIALPTDSHFTFELLTPMNPRIEGITNLKVFAEG